MKEQLKILLMLCLLITLTGCGTTMDNQVSEQQTEKSIAENTEIVSESLPVQWIFYEEEKYVFSKIIPKEEVDISLIETTGTQTKYGDGAKHGQEIYFYKKDSSLFIIDNEGPTEEWVNFIKN